MVNSETSLFCVDSLFVFDIGKVLEREMRKKWTSENLDLKKTNYWVWKFNMPR